MDTNSSEIARRLTALGVVVRRTQSLPDDLALVTGAITDALARSRLVVTTGGLGPTPDDLTREAIAAACGEEPHVDPGLERWLEAMFARRGLAMSERNRKQAWLIPSGSALSNANGTAPGWWVERGDGRVIVALPGPPREMRPMWRDGVEPRLLASGIGGEAASVTLRLTAIGESAAADLIGDTLLAGAEPSVATYARADAVDVRISAVGAGAEARVAPVAADLRARLAAYVFAEGDESWQSAIGRRLGARTVAVSEVGTAGQLTALLGSAAWFRHGATLGVGSGDAPQHGDLEAYARHVREESRVDIGIAVRARERDGDTAVTVAVATSDTVSSETRTAFLTGELGRQRAALVACAVLWKKLGEVAS